MATKRLTNEARLACALDVLRIVMDSRDYPTLLENLKNEADDKGGTYDVKFKHDVESIDLSFDGVVAHDREHDRKARRAKPPEGTPEETAKAWFSSPRVPLTLDDAKRLVHALNTLDAERVSVAGRALEPSSLENGLLSTLSEYIGKLLELAKEALPMDAQRERKQFQSVIRRTEASLSALTKGVEKEKTELEFAPADYEIVRVLSAFRTSAGTPLAEARIANYLLKRRACERTDQDIKTVEQAVRRFRDKMGVARDQKHKPRASRARRSPRRTRS